MCWTMMTHCALFSHPSPPPPPPQSSHEPRNDVSLHRVVAERLLRGSVLHSRADRHPPSSPPHQPRACGGGSTALATRQKGSLCLRSVAPRRGAASRRGRRARVHRQRGCHRAHISRHTHADAPNEGGGSVRVIERESRPRISFCSMLKSRRTAALSRAGFLASFCFVRRDAGPQEFIRVRSY